MKPFPTRVLICLLLATWLLPACVRLERQSPDKTSYVLAAERPPAPATHIRSGILQITPLRISRRFAGRGFVYRQAESRYQIDFYNQFLISPAGMVQEEIVRWLSASGLFAAVSSSAGPLPPDYLLQGRINDLHGDYRSQQPAAVLAISFMLLDQRGVGSPLLLDRDYRSRIPLNGTSPQALIDAWNAALTRILGDLENDLALIIEVSADGLPAKE